ncbi:MAG TPA: potassium channel family protein [Solirubrobacteraceae bacterium]|nr:potassium channel family protein [Solirubrobacteraceae bacterium]
MRTGRKHADKDGEERRKRFGQLLLAIIAAFAIQGVAEPGRWEQFVVSVLLTVTLLLALWVAEARPRVMRALASVGAVLVLVSLVGAISGDASGTAARLANLLLVVLAPPAIVVGVLRTVRARSQVTIEAVFGVLCLYLLLGMFFAALYGVMGHADGTFFASGVETTTPRCLYFSFTTLTTVGYGDLTANSNLGHTLAASEALLGQIYLVTIVSVIVGNLGRSRAQVSKPPQPKAG